ncbi:AAA family ATPase [Thermosulfuriphilus ammonigenes]|uniref:AAA family ATPase n=1 Tax=Thermosulfuriphilus ammonigenes TaxID=1936021 RepID=A0A6G7PV65_9BACT|nr:AAA family ATPase [Thermosulfuriphilus ammonigenes]MBA2848269.1 CO dehydrogenase maturation factor [Thermosulfuriphilus ammonigenes]QIJ71569.1 AAA family ATPase [Thermosulfuriphilus ammonigenes]
MKIAIAGKGGVGKSTISAFIIEALLEAGRRVLAIDADPSPHLARLLGFPEAEAIVPIAEMTDLLEERTGKEGAFYLLNPKVDDLPERFMLRRGPLSLMVVGAIRKGGGGCACPENTVLRNLINLLVFGAQEDLVLDMEAGVEHLGRGTLAGVDHLLVVVQPYQGSLETAAKIARLAEDLGLAPPLYLANATTDEADVAFIKEGLGVEPFGVFPYDPAVRRAERAGEPIAKSSPLLLQVAKEVVKKLADGA